VVTQKLFALKVIEKEFILNSNKENIIMNEREVMVNARHPFIV
jgi:hypothetical protein